MREIPRLGNEAGGGGSAGAIVPAAETVPALTTPVVVEASTEQPTPNKTADILDVVPKNEREEDNVSSQPEVKSRIQKVSEAIRDSGPVQGLLDRYQMLRDRLTAADIDTAVARANDKYNGLTLEAEKYKTEANDAERELTILRGLGDAVPTERLEHLEKKIQSKRDRQQKLEEEARVKGTRLQQLRTTQGVHETKANEVIGRINRPLDLKLTANQTEMQVLNTVETQLVAQLATLEKEYAELRKQVEEKAEEWRNQKRGRVKTDLEQETRRLGDLSQLKADQILRLERQVDKARLRTWDLKQINEGLEWRKTDLLGVSKEKKKKKKEEPLKLFHPRNRRRVAMQ